MPQTALDLVILHAAKRIRSRQQEDGSFSYCCEVSPLSDAMMVIFLTLLRCSDDGLVPGLCQRLLGMQRSDGGWRAYPDQIDNVSATALSVFALRLWQSGRHSAPTVQSGMARGAQYVRDHGGLAAASNLTKVILATAGQLPWTSLPQIHISSLVFSRLSPVNIYDFASFARVHIPSIMILSHLRFRYRTVPRDAELRDLVTRPLPPDHHVRRNEAALHGCRQYILSHLEPDGTLAGYLTATVFAVFALQALGYSRSHTVVVRAIEGLKAMVYRRGRFIHQQVFSSTIWDTALCTQALMESRPTGWRPATFRAMDFLVNKQHRRLSDWSVHTPDTPPGGWGFSRINTRFPDVDDTTAVLKILQRLPASSAYDDARRRGMRWLLAMQNDDGGWSAFDRNCNKAFLERIALNDMGRAVIDPSTADITGNVLELLASQGGHRARMERAVACLRRQQRSDGSWFGRWGIAFIYGTWAALRGLSAAGVGPEDAVMTRARSWLESIQHADGGFGESCRSDSADRFSPLEQSNPSQAAWGLMALMYASAGQTPAIRKAARFLMTSARPKGGWRERYPTGAGVAGQAYLRYHSYAQVWPLMALCQYRKRSRKG